VFANHMPGRSQATPTQYEDDARRYQMTLSKHWHDFSQHPALRSVTNPVQTRLIAFIKPPGNVSIPNVTIQTYGLSNHPDIQSAMDYARVARSSNRGTELRAPETFSHEGLTGVRWEYAYSNGLASVHSVTDYYLDGRTMILVSAVSRPERFEQDKQDILPLLDSFHFTAKTPFSTRPLSRN
jgi:hypothetical protein